MSSSSIPKYIKELHYFKYIKSAFIVEGNINDIYPIYGENGEIIRYANLLQLLAGIFDFGKDNCKNDLLYCDANIGFEDPLYTGNTASLVRQYEKLAEEEKDNIKNLNGKVNKRDHHSSNKIILTSEIIRHALIEPITDENKKTVIVVIDDASRLCLNSGNLSVDESVIFSNLKYGIQNSFKGNTLIFVCEKSSDIPKWVRESSNIKDVIISLPDREIRETYIKSKIQLKDNDNKKSLEKLIDFSDKLQLSELNQINQLYKNNDFTLEESMMIYRFGIREKLWKKLQNKINHLNLEEELSKRVKGQKQAIKVITNTLKKAVNGMNNLSSNALNTQPIMRCLLTGPTGVGKTELIKALAELLFADERAVIRFDMGEYSTEGSEAKLIGSPPGYVGYGNSGELVNALKQNPNCILLFDEIEKAHDKVFTLMLSLLDDGRVTSGDGETVYASDTLIFFTSNIGIAKIIRDPQTGETKKVVNVDPDSSHEELEKSVLKEINNFFKPEFIGRLSDIIIFDFLNEKVAVEILKLKINTIIRNLYEHSKITLVVDDTAINYLSLCCQKEETRQFGGRSIKNFVEKTFENAVSDFIIYNPNIKTIIATVDNNTIVCKEG